MWGNELVKVKVYRVVYSEHLGERSKSYPDEPIEMIVSLADLDDQIIESGAFGELDKSRYHVYLDPSLVLYKDDKVEFNGKTHLVISETKSYHLHNRTVIECE